MPKSIGRKGIIAIVLALIAVIGVASLAFFTDRVDHSMQFTTASFSADGYKLTRTAPEGPFCAGEEVTATLKESNTGDDDVNSVISMKATWVSPDTSLSIFGNANAADNATLSIGGTKVDYTVNEGNKSITFDLPKQVLAAGTKDAARDLTLTIPASFKSTGRIEFTFEKVVVAQEGGGFSKEYSRTDLNAASDLDYSVKVGWAASSIEAQNGKALMGYLTDKNASGKFGIEFELAFNYTESPMKDFASRTGAKWSYYKDKADRLTFVEGMTTIGDYAFPDFSGVKSVSFPTTVKTIGLSAFDASGLTGTVTIPATVKEIKSLAFGNLPNVKTFTFGHTTDSLTLPDNTAAGKRNTGAFYVPTHVDTTVNTTVEAIMYGYKWHDGYDNRRLVPTLNAQDTWFRTYTSGSNYTAKLDEDVLETITFADYHMPVTGETSWDASDPSVPGTVTAFLSADKKSLILAGNGYGLIFANEDSSGAFSSLTALKSVSNTDLLDTRNATTMADMFNFDKKLANISVTTWNVSKLEDTSEMFADSGLTSIDLSMWDESIVNSVYGMFRNCKALTSVNLNGWNLSNLEDGTTDNRKGSAGMFSGCTALTELNIPASLKVFGQNFAANCTSLNKITFLHDAGTVLTFPTAGATYGAFYVDPAMRTTQIVGQNTSAKAYSWVKDQRAAIPTLAAQNTWYKGTTAKSAITGIEIVDSYSGASTESWDASAAQDGSVKAYINGTKLIIAGNGYGKVLANADSTSAFNAFTNVTSFTGLNKLDTSNVTNMQTMFNNLDNIQTLDLSSFNTSKVTNFYSVFGGNDKLTTLNLTGWDTSAAKDMGQMFYVCNALTTINGLSSFNTANVTDMSGMFYGCKALTSLDLSKFDTSNVTSMRAMFYECENLTSVDVSKFDTASVTNVEAMFQGCKALTAVGDVSGWNTAKVTSMYQVFYGCEKLAALDLSGWNTINVTNMQAMFLDCTSLTSVGDLSGWNTAKVTEMAILFGNCEKLASLDVSKFNTAAVTNMNAMFGNCSALTTLDVSGFDTAKTTNLAAMFSGCVSLTSLDVSNWNTSNVTTMEATFQKCKKLTTMGDVSGWDTSKVTNMREMFCQCNLIASVDVTNWKTGNVTNMNGIFSNCEKLTSVGDLSGWDTSSATDMGWIFNSCFKLTGMGDISQWDTSNATKMNCLFATCESLTELDLSGWDTSKVTDMNNIFGGYKNEQLEESEIAGECVLLRKITLGAKFKFVGTDSYLPEPDSRYISGADGKWYAGSTGYTPAELAGLNRTEAVTYVAVKGTKTMSILSGDNAVSGYSISE